MKVFYRSFGGRRFRNSGAKIIKPLFNVPILYFGYFVMTILTLTGSIMKPTFHALSFLRNDHLNVRIAIGIGGPEKGRF